MTKKQHQEVSFYRKIRMSLGLMGIIPFLLISYLVMAAQISLSNTIVLASALVLFSILMGFTLLRQSADQLSSLAKETSTVKETETIKPLELHIDGELKDIATNFNLLVARLDQANKDIQEQNIQLLRYANDLDKSYEQLKKEEQRRNQLNRYIGKDLVEQIMDSNGELLLKNQRKTVTIMFADIRSFTSLSEKMSPEAVVDMLNEYYSIMVEIVFKNNGVLDKFVGDQLMAVFGHISSEGKGAKHALLAALEMQQAIAILMKKRKKRRQPVFATGIGINTGVVLMGNVGSENRMDYTVIGDTVNAAARLEEQALGGEIIIGEQTLAHLPKTIRVGKPQELKVKNRAMPITCYTIGKKKSDTIRPQKEYSPTNIVPHTPYMKTATV